MKILQLEQFKKDRWSYKRVYVREKRLQDIDTEEYTVWAHKIESYNFFKKNKPQIKKVGKIDKYKFSSIVNEIYSTIGKHVADSQDGVHIEGLGYFGGAIYSDKVLNSKPMYHKVWEIGIPLLSEHTDGKEYCILFTHDKGKPLSRTFLPDYCFSQNVRSRYSQNLLAGKKYRYNATLFI